jgi:hypothetical protein
MFATSSPAFAEQAFAEVTCATPDGTEQTFSIGWDNSNQFFDGRGEIPRLYCEGGYANGYPIYVRDNLPADSPLRWYNGIASVVEPTLEPTPEIVDPTPVVTQTPEPEPTASIEPSLNPEPTPIPEPSQSESPSIEPTPEPVASPQPVVTPTLEVTPSPTPTVSQVAPVPVVEPSPTPSQSLAEPTPTPSEIVAPDLAPDLEPTPEPVNEQVVALEVPSALASVPGIVALFEAAEAFMNIGSDMTDEQREESQSVVVAAVIVTQLAMRKTK